VIASAGAMAVSLGVFTAPAAFAGPAPRAVESSYIHILALNGVDVGGQEGDALKLGYLVCALDQTGGKTVAGTEAFLGAAQAGGLCDYVTPASQGTTCPRTGAWSVQCSLAREAIANTPGSGNGN
jgi:hypothetical protein